MKAGCCGPSLLVLLFFAHLSALRAQSAAAPAVPPAARAASFERLGDLLDQGRLASRAGPSFPATVDGEPVKVIYILTINYQLGGDDTFRRRRDRGSHTDHGPSS